MPTQPTRAPLVPVAVLAAVLVAVLTAGPAAARVGDLPPRTVDTKVVLNDKNQLVMRGDVTPGHAHRWVFVQKKNCRKSSCPWHAWSRVETNGHGKFRARIAAPRSGSDYFRARVPQHDGYATSYSRVWRTWTD